MFKATIKITGNEYSAGVVAGVVKVNRRTATKQQTIRQTGPSIRAEELKALKVFYNSFDPELSIITVNNKKAGPDILDGFFIIT